MVTNISNTPLSTGLTNNLSLSRSNLSISTKDSSVYYAKKGEPIYMKEMDADEDGVITFDEFKDYCQANGISSKEMVRMLQTRAAYHLNKDREKAEKKSKEEKSKDSQNKADTEFVYAKEGDLRYDELMDYNSDGKVTYKEYFEYCKEHSKSKQEKSDTIIDENNEEEFKTINKGQAINAYSEAETQIIDSLIECEA